MRYILAILTWAVITAVGVFIWNGLILPGLVLSATAGLIMSVVAGFVIGVLGTLAAYGVLEMTE